MFMTLYCDFANASQCRVIFFVLCCLQCSQLNVLTGSTNGFVLLTGLCTTQDKVYRTKIREAGYETTVEVAVMSRSLWFHHVVFSACYACISYVSVIFIFQQLFVFIGVVTV